MSAPYWYFVTTWECVSCGRGRTTRERRYTPKPQDPNERYSFEQVYDWCDSL